MSAEQLKSAVREYVSEQFGECRSASVVIDLGRGVPPEMLTVAVSLTSNFQAPRRSPGLPSASESAKKA
jgi:hypothetical protein